MSSEAEEDVCWICLCSSEKGEGLQSVCGCPRQCHPSCLARWQLQQAGKREERYCRFCEREYPDWKNALTPREIKPTTPIMAVSVRGRVHKLRVCPGPEGKEDFKRQVRQLLGYSDDMEFDVIFECKTPHSGEKVQLQGFSAFDAATHCAAVSAAKRLKNKQQQKQRQLQQQQQQQQECERHAASQQATSHDEGSTSSLIGDHVPAQQPADVAGSSAAAGAAGETAEHMAGGQNHSRSESHRDLQPPPPQPRQQHHWSTGADLSHSELMLVAPSRNSNSSDGSVTAPVMLSPTTSSDSWNGLHGHHANNGSSSSRHTGPDVTTPTGLMHNQQPLQGMSAAVRSTSTASADASALLTAGSSNTGDMRLQTSAPALGVIAASCPLPSFPAMAAAAVAAATMASSLYESAAVGYCGGMDDVPGHQHHHHYHHQGVSLLQGQSADGSPTAGSSTRLSSSSSGLVKRLSTWCQRLSVKRR